MYMYNTFGNHIYILSSVPLIYSLFSRHISFSLFMSITFNIIHTCVSIHNTNTYLVLNDSKIFSLAAIFVLWYLWSLMYSLIERHAARNYTMYAYICEHIHTCSSACIHPYMYTYIHVFLHPSTHIYIHAVYLHTCIYTCIVSCMSPYIHTKIHIQTPACCLDTYRFLPPYTCTWKHTYIMHAHICTFRFMHVYLHTYICTYLHIHACLPA